MHLENIAVNQFKNIHNLSLEFSPYINCLVGPNGSGKTNLLDAIHYLCLTKSAFSAIDYQNIHFNADYFSIRGTYKIGDKSLNISCSLKKGEKKVFKAGRNPYDKLRDHIGRLPIVMIAPNDTELIDSGSEIRRRFLDSTLSQFDSQYLEHLIKYNQLLKQRNRVLKNIFETGRMDNNLLSSYDEQIVPLAMSIAKKREKFTDQLSRIFSGLYIKLSKGVEKMVVQYQSHCMDQHFSDKFRNSLSKDIELQRTMLGPHRDDLLFFLNQHSLKKFGSQGQKKTFLLALKLSQFEILRQQHEQTPMVLLDDIFDKLDDERIRNLLEMVTNEPFQQIFLTDARPERTNKFLDELAIKAKVIDIGDEKTQFAQ